METLTVQAAFKGAILANIVLKKVIQSGVAFQTMGQIVAVSALVDPAQATELVFQEIFSGSVASGAC